MTEVFEIAGALVKSDAADNLMRLIAEEGDEDELESTGGLRKYAADWFSKKLKQALLKSSKPMPDILIQVHTILLAFLKLF